MKKKEDAQKRSVWESAIVCLDIPTFVAMLASDCGESEVSRLTIDVTDQQHQRLKALAALQGKTMKEYAIEKLSLSRPGRGTGPH